MNYNGLPDGDEDTTRTSFDNIMYGLQTLLLTVGLLSFVLAACFLWGYYVG